MHHSSHVTALNEETYRQALAELSAKDSDLAGVILKWGNPPFWTHAPGFPGIVIAILAQQVSLESARGAFARLEKAIGWITPEGFSVLDNGALRSIGFSRQKASYVLGIAHEIMTGAFDFATLNAMDNDAVRKRLTEFKGIGPWTADNYLLFSMRRPDAWPSGDLALAKAAQELKGLTDTPCSEEVDEIAGRWKPFRAVAARILWHHYLCERGRGVSA
jgi:DNA-3-methyladenine glycosylase II